MQQQGSRNPPAIFDCASGWGSYLFAAFKALANLDFLLAAVFLWSMFFDAALSIVEAALLRISRDKESLFSIASLAFFIVVLRADFLITLFKVLTFDTFTLFIADFMFGKSFTSCELVNIRYFTMKEFKMQGLCRLELKKVYVEE